MSFSFHKKKRTIESPSLGRPLVPIGGAFANQVSRATSFPVMRNASTSDSVQVDMDLIFTVHIKHKVNSIFESENETVQYDDIFHAVMIVVLTGICIDAIWLDEHSYMNYKQRYHT